MGSSRAPRPSSGKQRQRKVAFACVYCQRSHMTCDESRPCQRCIRRRIGHLCCDRERPDQNCVPAASATLHDSQAGKRPKTDMQLACKTVLPRAFDYHSSCQSFWRFCETKCVPAGVIERA